MTKKSNKESGNPPKNPSDFKADVNFLFEIGTLRHVARTWNQFGGLPLANDAEHTFRVAMTAWLIAKHEGADIGHVVKMALAHDITETRTGDVHYLSRLYVDRHETAAAADQTTGVGAGEEIRALLAEYEERQTLAAKVLKDADNLDIDLEIMEMIARGESVGARFAEKRDIVRDKLFTATAKRLWDTIYAGDPNAWHFESKNRFTAGDWQTQDQK
jgi:putative hydrolase of HD superfamily